jgi:LysM repeat protein
MARGIPKPLMRRAGRCVALGAALAAAWASSAHGQVAHTVAPGESLTSIAATDGLSAEAVAAANGLSIDAELLAGETITIPDARGYGSDSSATVDTGAGAGTGGGSYVVQPGDTLSGIAAAAGMSTGELASLNGIGVDVPLVAGTALSLAGGGGGSTGSSAGGPIATPDVVSGEQIAEQAASQNVGPNFAKAVAWQESGWDNSQVSSADARGVMQITPETWDFVQTNLADRPLDPTSAVDNVRAGATYLGYLFDQTGNDPASTLGGYYQGLGSVVNDGLLPETWQYIDSVLALRDNFAGG